MNAAHLILWIMAIGYPIGAVCLLIEAKSHRSTYLYVAAGVALMFLVDQLSHIAKDAVAFVDGIALILIGVACGLILSEAVRRHVAEKRPEANGTVEA